MPSNLEKWAVILGFAFLLVCHHVLLILPMKFIDWLRRERLDYDEVRRGYTRALLLSLRKVGDDEFSRPDKEA